MTRFLARFVAVASVAAIAFVATGCSSSLDNAATMTGGHITNTTLRNELNKLLDNKDFAAGLAKNNFAVNHGKRSVEARVTAIWLTQLLQQFAVDQEYNARHLTATSADRNSAKQQVDGGFGTIQSGKQKGQPAAQRFPKAFYNLLIDREARLIALAKSLQVAPKAPTVVDARKYYDDNKAQLFACDSGKTVAHITVADQATANSVLAQARAGTSFATLAQQHSTDTTTKSTGGVIQPSQGIRNCYVAGEHPDVDSAVNTATVGQATGPIKTSNGYDVILVTNYTAPSFESVQSAILQQLAQTAQQNAGTATNAALTRVLEKRLRNLHVHVAPQYGRFVIDPQSGPQVVPPTAPAVRESRNSRSSASTTTTTTTPAGG